MNTFMKKISIILLFSLSFSMVNSGCNNKKSESTKFSLGVWMWGSTLLEENAQTVVNKLVDHNITEVYFLVKGTAGKKTNSDNLTEFITKAHAKNIRVHLWYVVSDDGVFIAENPDAGVYHCPKPPKNVRPYPLNDNRVTLFYPEYKKYVLENIRYFLTNFDCDGFHLDCIRYAHFIYSFDPYSLREAAAQGCDTTRLLSFFNTEESYKANVEDKNFINLYTNRDKDVVKWVEMRKKIVYDYIKETKDIIEEIRPEIKFTAAFMPEGATDTVFSDVYYAQNYKYHSALLDMISPMVYFKSFGKTTNWLKTMTEGAIKLVEPNCEIVTGIQAFDGVTATELKEQIEYSFEAGARGIILFRYGTVTEACWDAIKEWNNKK